MIYYQLLLISVIYFLFTEVNIVSFRNFAPKMCVTKQMHLKSRVLYREQFAVTSQEMVVGPPHSECRL